jgi:hypothetical protein
MCHRNRPTLRPGDIVISDSPTAITFRSPFSRLVYPIPAPGGLGVHLTLGLAGQARFGPDVGWVETIDYDVDPRRAESFYAAIRTIGPICRTARCSRATPESARRLLALEGR